MHIVVRALWFVFVGWWVGLLWLSVAILAALTAIWYNVGVFMFINTWNLVTLKEPPRKVIEDVRAVR